MLVSILMLACLDRTLAECSFILTKWLNILDDYLDRILVRCELTAKSNMEHNISATFLSFYIFYEFTKVKVRIATANRIIKGVLYSPWESLIKWYTLFCNSFRMPLLLIAPTLRWGSIWLIRSSILSTVYVILFWFFIRSLNTLPKTNNAKLLSVFA